MYIVINHQVGDNLLQQQLKKKTKNKKANIDFGTQQCSTIVTNTLKMWKWFLNDIISRNGQSFEILREKLILAVNRPGRKYGC